MLLTGNQLQQRGITIAELLQYLKDGLQPYNLSEKPIAKKSVDRVLERLSFHALLSIYGIATSQAKKARLLKLVTARGFSVQRTLSIFTMRRQKRNG